MLESWSQTYFCHLQSLCSQINVNVGFLWVHMCMCHLNLCCNCITASKTLATRKKRVWNTEKRNPLYPSHLSCIHMLVLLDPSLYQKQIRYSSAHGATSTKLHCYLLSSFCGNWTNKQTNMLVNWKQLRQGDVIQTRVNVWIVSWSWLKVGNGDIQFCHGNWYCIVLCGTCLDTNDTFPTGISKISWWNIEFEDRTVS